MSMQQASQRPVFSATGSPGSDSSEQQLGSISTLQQLSEPITACGQMRSFQPGPSVSPGTSKSHRRNQR
jgi:hypothetical protein